LFSDSWEVHFESVEGDDEFYVAELVGEVFWGEVVPLDELSGLGDAGFRLVESDNGDGFVDAFGFDVEADGVVFVGSVEIGPVA